MRSVLCKIKTKLRYFLSFYYLYKKTKNLNELRNFFGKKKPGNNTRKLKLLYIVHNKSVWKTDSLYRKLSLDPLFEQLILIAPYFRFGDDTMHSDILSTFQYFNGKGYSTVNALDENGDFVDIKAVFEPDLVFFSSPFDLGLKKYYSDVYFKYNCCYVPYYYEMSKLWNSEMQYGSEFHRMMYKIFAPHDVSEKLYIAHSSLSGSNVELVGYPAMEPFMAKNHRPTSPWKKQNNKKFKIIWAPHHTIDSPELPYSNFLKYAEFLIDLVERYQDSIQWAFKPHPILKPKLIIHPDWGQKRTQEFWSFWENHPNCQLEEGEYVDLFLTSDAMIHDSGSFLAEYLYTNKPVLYLTSSTNMKEFFNPFGCEAFDACYHAFNVHDIEVFIGNLFSGNDPMQSQRQAFLEKHVLPFFINTTPSDRIIEIIKKDFGIL